MSITSVTLEISPELSQKLWDYGNVNGGADKGCAAADAMLHYYGINKSDLTVTPAIIAAWCEGWFGAEAIREYRETDWLMEPDDPACCVDPMINDFVQEIVSLYRHCHTKRRSF